jgi:translation initiation factor 1A
MPPNKKGGKGYKKGKHESEDPIIFERLPDQMYGRVVRLLGGCNALVYCNDNRERLCHIRGSMRKKVWIETGDIVLISIRDMTSRYGADDSDRGDICAKYDPKVIYKLREKDKSINEKLFTIIEKTDLVGKKSGNVPDGDDGFGFIFVSEDNEIVNDEGSDSGPDETMLPKNRAEAKKAMMRQEQDEDDVNIDDI